MTASVLHSQVGVYLAVLIYKKSNMESTTDYRAAKHYDFCRIITIFCSSLCHYAHTLKTTVKLPFPVIFLYGAVLSLFYPHTVSQCLYFGEYHQAVTCSAQPLWC